jgi:hypothetical protein
LCPQWAGPLEDTFVNFIYRVHPSLDQTGIEIYMFDPATHRQKPIAGSATYTVEKLAIARGQHMSSI